MNNDDKFLYGVMGFFFIAVCIGLLVGTGVLGKILDRTGLSGVNDGIILAKVTDMDNKDWKIQKEIYNETCSVIFQDVPITYIQDMPVSFSPSGRNLCDPSTVMSKACFKLCDKFYCRNRELSEELYNTEVCIEEKGVWSDC